LIAAALLCAGYIDLVRGGITASAILLALGYCAAIPWAILAGGPGERTGRGVSPREAFLAGGVVFGLYLLTLSRTTALWDASEYIAAAYTFGLPHPPGNPLFIVLGRVFAVLPIAPNVAMRINVLAALSSAVAAAVWYLVARRVADRSGLGPTTSRLTAGIATLIGATAFTVWSQSVVNEKVYTVSLAGIAIVSWLMLRWSDRPDDPRADRYLVLVAYLLGLGYANHMAGMLPLPAALLLVSVTRPAAFLRWRLIVASLAAIVLGMTPFATQPIRSAHNPAINEGEPTACRDGFALSCTFSKGTWDAFTYNFDRGQYGKPVLTERQAPFIAQVGMWWLYFRWQWLRDAHGEHGRSQGALASAFFVLALIGGLLHYRHDRRGFWYFGTLMLLTTVVLIYYLNFRYGASQSPELAVDREVRDRDYFFLWSFSAWGVWAAAGLVWMWRSLASLVARRADATRLPAWSLAATAPILLVAAIPLVGNWSAASRRHDATAPSFARDLLNSVEPYAVLVTGGDNDTFPLWYAQEVEGVRRDVTVAVTSLMNTDWFARAMIRRPVHPYDADSGPPVYRDGSWPRPGGPPMRLTVDEVDAVPPYLLLREPLRFRKHSLDVTIEPRNLPQVQGGGILERADLLLLRMIADSWPERPIYISRTAGGYAATLGLQGHVLTQGLARKLVPAPADLPDTVLIPGSGWFDVPRSHALWQDFDGPDAMIRRNDWIDGPSIGIAYSYLLLGSELGSALVARGDTTAADSVFHDVRRVARAVRVAMASDAPPPPARLGDTAR
jgi:hypothetical protein